MSVGESVLVALFTNGVVFVVLALLWVLILFSNKAISAAIRFIAWLTGWLSAKFGRRRPQQQ